MLETNGGTVRKVAWTELCPWLGLVHTFRVAISLRVLVLGALGGLLTVFGWGLLGRAFFDHEQAALHTQQILVGAPLSETSGGTPADFSPKASADPRPTRCSAPGST